jgi:AraC family transcriptional regulator, chitin signaling transcriptional activator
MAHFRRIFILLLLLPCMEAQELPPFQNFTAETYHGETQNWSICQSLQNNIYFANNLGLLEYNGASWKLYPSPNHTIMRSVSVLGDKIYTGCHREFGYWQKDGVSNMKYISLSEKIKNKLLDDEQFWKIICYQKWVLFQSLHRIYIYDTLSKKFQIIEAKTNLPKMFEVEHKIYFQKINEGIFQLQDGKPLLVSDFSLFKKDIVIGIFPFEGKLLMQTQNNGFYIWANNNTSEWKTNDIPKIKTMSVYSSIQLRDGGFALGTIGEGLYILSPTGQIKVHLDKKNGLQNNTVLSLFEDANETIWLGLDNGISLVNYKSPFQVYFDTKGIFGTIYAEAFYDSYLYIGTNQGLFYKKSNSDEDFKLVGKTKGQVWTLKTIDGVLFCGHNSGTYIIKGNKAFQIADILGTWEIKQVAGNPNLLIQGNYEGLHVLEKKNGSWQYRNKIEGFDISSRYFEQMPNNKIFVNHEYKGLFELEVTSDLRRVKSCRIIRSVPKSFNSGMAKFNNKLLYFCNLGLYEYTWKKNEFQKNQALTKLILNNDNYISGKLIHDEKQILWAFTEDNIVQLSPNGIDDEPQVTRIPLPLSIRENVSGFENILHVANKEYMIGTTNGYVLIDLNKMTDKKYTIQINNIEKNKLNNKKIAIPISENECRLKIDENNLSFSFDVPAYDRFFQTKYQYKLEGLESSWSIWSKESSVSFKNLPSGNYRFMVRAKVGNKLTTNTASFQFTISKVWYASNWIIALYVLLFLFVLVIINHQYKRRYKRHEQHIYQEKQKELMSMQLENEKLKNEKLSLEIDSKSKELASTTMAIVNKNELLNAIKSELLQEKNSSSVRSALQIIDNDLLNNNHWEAFQEAFNNIDRNFLKKIKEFHPSLTPNDLKLCVYLRLNLSSKEIAPMLNISAQSVEIKRFRLRKKIGLNHEQNLTEYILSL